MSSNCFCETCNISFTRPYHYREHIKTKKHIQNVLSSKIEKHEDVPYNIVKHLCQQFDTKLKELKQELRQEFEKKITNLECQLKKSSPNIQNSGHIGDNITVNIHINPHGRENWSYILPQLPKMIRRTNILIPELVRKLHFDKEHPENHNLQVSNINSNRIKVKDRNGKWISADKHAVLTDEVRNIYDFIENEGDEETLLEKCSPNIRRLYEEKKARFTGSTDDPINRKAQKSLMKELYYLIYQEHKDHKDIAHDYISETVITKL